VLRSDGRRSSRRARRHLGALGLLAALWASPAAGADPPCDPGEASRERSARVLQEAFVRPVASGGRFAGIRITGIAEGGAMRAAGIRDGDVVVEAAGQPLVDVVQATLFFCLIGEGEPFPFRVRRDTGEIAELVFPAVP